MKKRGRDIEKRKGRKKVRRKRGRNMEKKEEEKKRHKR